MQIAFAHDWLVNYAGSEQLLFYLHQLYPQAPIFTTIYNQAKVDESQFNPKVVRTSWLQNIPGSKWHHQLFVPLMPKAIGWDFSDFDLVISDSSWAMKGLRARKHIAIILTPTRWLWHFGGDQRADNIFARPLITRLRQWDLAAAKRPDVLIAISKTVQERITKIYQRSSTIVYPPVEVDRFKPLPENQIGDYFLTVGRLVAYKRVDLIVDAFNQLGWPLKIIGSGPEEKRLRQMAKGNIELIGSLSDKERDDYYLHARAFIFAADEDFGIVPVEAMAAGRPVIAPRRGGATETVTEGISGLFFDQQDSQSLICCLKKFNQTNFNSHKISQSVAKFNPQRFKTEMQNIINSTL